tara:strand:+ start:57 stop:281 length:225 start_codon:yes stop_codon:yes gene_type:complete
MPNTELTLNQLKTLNGGAIELTSVISAGLLKARKDIPSHLYRKPDWLKIPRDMKLSINPKSQISIRTDRSFIRR